MDRSARSRVIPLFSCLLAVLAVALVADAKPEAGSGRIDFEVRLEPADLAPGGEGVLVVHSVIKHELHTYADSTEALLWRPVPVEGVTYQVPHTDAVTWEKFEEKSGKVTWTEPMMRPIPGFPDAPPDAVWQEGYEFEIRVPVTLAASVPADARLGLVFDYSACDEMNCFDRIRGHEAVVQLGASSLAEESEASDGAEEGEGAFVPGVSPEDQAGRVTLEVREEDDGTYVAIVTFAPNFGYHLYRPDASGGYAISIEPLADDGITWGTWDFPFRGQSFSEPYPVGVPFQRDPARAKRIRLKVEWQGCDDIGNCARPAEGILAAHWTDAAGNGTGTSPMVDRSGSDPGGSDPSGSDPGGSDPGGSDPSGTNPKDPAGTDPSTEGEPILEGERVLVRPSEETPFPVIYGDDLDEPRVDGNWKERDSYGAKSSDIEEKMGKGFFLFLGGVFLLGIGLSFTPCVLPIIPLTISVIGGGITKTKKKEDEADLDTMSEAQREAEVARRAAETQAEARKARRRLTVLLSAYVLGLSLTYGAAGAVSGLLGEAIDVEAAFRLPGVILGISLLFIVLSWGMFGIFEMQPPAWMEGLRGGAQRRQGTLLGSFLLGVLAAVIASPCTGPFVVGMLAFVATTQSPLIGFIVFFTLGLGMGAVFFAAGSLNMLARPGPWMVHVRNFFGVVLVGVALYYLGNGGLVPTWGLLAIGAGVALLAWLLVTHHLMVREFEGLMPSLKKGGLVALGIAIVTCIVTWMTCTDDNCKLLVLQAATVLAAVLVVGFALWAYVLPKLVRIRKAIRASTLLFFPDDKERDELIAQGKAPYAPYFMLMFGTIAAVVGLTFYSFFHRPTVKGPEGWIKLESVAHLKEQVERAKQEGKPVILDVWATWCKYCKLYDVVIEGDEYLSRTFEDDLVRLKIDVESDDRWDLRKAVGLGDGQPLMAFLDEQGRVRRAADILQFHHGDSAYELKRRVNFLLRRPAPVKE